MQISLPPPADLNGDLLKRELADVNIEADLVFLDIVDGNDRALVVCVPDGTDEATVESVVAAHQPAAVHIPLDPFGRLLTLLAVYQGDAIPVEELAAMGNYTPEQLEAEFYAWLEAGGE